MNTNKVKVVGKIHQQIVHRLPSTLEVEAIWSGGRWRPSIFTFSLSHIHFHTFTFTFTYNKVETGRLPTPRAGLQAAVIDNHIFVTGGKDGHNHLAQILRWDPSTESWQHVGSLTVGRESHAAVVIPSSLIESECSRMFLK